MFKKLISYPAYFEYAGVWLEDFKHPDGRAVGIEVPNKNRSVVGFREIIEMDLPEWKKMAVPVILGKDILGKAQLIDLVKTPHPKPSTC